MNYLLIMRDYKEDTYYEFDNDEWYQWVVAGYQPGKIPDYSGTVPEDLKEAYLKMYESFPSNIGFGRGNYVSPEQVLAGALDDHGVRDRNRKDSYDGVIEGEWF